MVMKLKKTLRVGNNYYSLQIFDKLERETKLQLTKQSLTEKSYFFN